MSGTLRLGGSRAHDPAPARRREARGLAQIRRTALPPRHCRARKGLTTVNALTDLRSRDQRRGTNEASERRREQDPALRRVGERAVKGQPGDEDEMVKPTPASAAAPSSSDQPTPRQHRPARSNRRVAAPRIPVACRPPTRVSRATFRGDACPSSSARASGGSARTFCNSRSIALVTDFRGTQRSQQADQDAAIVACAP